MLCHLILIWPCSVCIHRPTRSFIPRRLRQRRFFWACFYDAICFCRHPSATFSFKTCQLITTDSLPRRICDQFDYHRINGMIRYRISDCRQLWIVCLWSTILMERFASLYPYKSNCEAIFISFVWTSCEEKRTRWNRAIFLTKESEERRFYVHTVRWFKQILEIDSI